MKQVIISILAVAALFVFLGRLGREPADGRVLVTGRNVNGGPGTYAWCGDLGAEAGRRQIAGPRRKYPAGLTPDALVIENRPEQECRYSLLPPAGNAGDLP